MNGGGTRSVFPSYLAYSYNRKLNPLRKSLLNLMRQLKRMLGLRIRLSVCAEDLYLTKGLLPFHYTA